MAVLLVGVGACGSGGEEGGATRADIVADVEAEYDATTEQAECVADYVVEDYSPAEVELLHEDGLAALPPGQWDRWFSSVLACLTLSTP